jgi:hypothetical protein
MAHITSACPRHTPTLQQVLKAARCALVGRGVCQAGSVDTQAGVSPHQLQQQVSAVEQLHLKP